MVASGDAEECGVHGPEPPSLPTIIGGLVVLAGTMIAFVGLLPGYKRPGWRQTASAVGVLVVGVGTAASFLGGALHLNRSDYDALSWGLFALAILLILAILAPYHLPPARLNEARDDHATRDEPGDANDGEGGVSVYVIVYEGRVDVHRSEERKSGGDDGGDSVPPFGEAHETVYQPPHDGDIPHTPPDRGG